MHTMTLHKLDDDFISYHGNNYDPEYQRDDALGIVAQIPGYADGDWWHWVVALTDGRFAYTRAWCDFTGWT